MKPLCFAIILATLCTACLGNDVQCKVTFAIVNQNVVITIENTSDTKLPIYEIPKSRDEAPAHLWVKIRNRNNQIVSISTTNDFGYWSPYMRSAEFFVLPLKKRKMLAPKSCHKINIPLDTLLRNIELPWRDKTEEYLFIFSFLLHTDPNMENSFSFESDWMKINPTKEK